MKDKAINLSKKIGAGAGLTGSAILLLIAYTDSKVEAIQETMALKDRSIREYVDLRHTNVSKRLDDIIILLEKIDNRLYELNKRGK